MDQQVITTTPNPPVGQLTPEVPLGISASLTPNTMQPDTKPLQVDQTQNAQWTYIDRFEISNDSAAGTFLWKWNSYEPLTTKFQVFKGASFTSMIYLPHSLKEAYWASFLNVEWELKFEPIKVTDSRVEIIISQGFIGNTDDSSNLKYGDTFMDSTQLWNETEIHAFDSPETVVIFKPKLFQPQSKMMNNDSIEHFTNPESFGKLWPSFAPTTTVVVRQKSEFVNNSLQPNTFKVNVWIRPIITAMSEFTSRCLNTSLKNSSIYQLSYSPYPWWLYREVNTPANAIKDAYPKLKLEYTWKSILENLEKYCESKPDRLKTLIAQYVSKHE